ncbi:MAG TPA: hypothetical protein VN648_22245, partial [Candidatus Methylomirabilis sp.]|nr:hypothetical protein [Candidatus Methylomirabilis sp.]
SADPAGSTISLRSALSSNPAPWPGIGSSGKNQYVLSLQDRERNFFLALFFPGIPGKPRNFFFG